MWVKPQNYCEISTLLLSYLVPVKSKVEISQNFCGLLRIYELYTDKKIVITWLVELIEVDMLISAIVSKVLHIDQKWQHQRNWIPFLKQYSIDVSTHMNKHGCNYVVKDPAHKYRPFFYDHTIYMRHNQESSKVNTAYASNTVWPRTSEYMNRTLKLSNT